MPVARGGAWLADWGCELQKRAPKVREASMLARVMEASHAAHVAIRQMTERSIDCQSDQASASGTTVSRSILPARSSSMGTGWSA